MMLVAVSAAHGRHALTRVWARHTASLGFDLVSVCLTEGDEENWRTLKPLCATSGNGWNFTVVSKPNEPLAGKFNEALAEALDCGAMRIMILPSDDFVSPAWVEAARTTDLDYIVPHCLGVYDLKSGQGYRIDWHGSGVLKYGAGRVISRKAIEKIGGELWPEGLNRGLDTASHNRLIAHGIKPTVVTTDGIPITDVKTYVKDEHGRLVNDSLWPFVTWEPGSPRLSEEKALHMLSDDTKAELIALR